MIRLAGIEMLAEGSSGSLGDFLDKYQPIEDTRAFAGMPAALLSPTLHGKRKGCSTGPGIAPQNYPLRIAPRLNTFYWPSGATRWGHGLFLANETDTTAIVTKANGGASSGSDSSSGSSGNSSVLLEMGDEDQYVMSTKVYVLPPRPVTLGDDSGDNPKLYIIPVVDERYWWQFIDADDISVGSTTTWMQLISIINLRLAPVTSNALTVPDDIDARFLQPDPVEFTRKFENVAVLIDAIASSLGRRLVRSLLTPGQITLESAATSTTTLDANATNEEWTQIAGGKFLASGTCPASVLVKFRKINLPTGDDGTFYTASNDTSGDSSVAGSRRVFNSSAFANYLSGGTNPDNVATLTDLAAAICTAFAAWFARRYDFTFNGMRKWEPTGFDNSIEWSFGRDLGSGNCIAQTRVQSIAGDVFSETQLSQDPNLSAPLSCGGQGKIIGRLCSDLNSLVSDSDISLIPGYTYNSDTGQYLTIPPGKIINPLNKAGSHNDEIWLRYDAVRLKYLVEDVQMVEIRPATQIVDKPTLTDGMPDDSGDSCVMVTGPKISAYLSFPNRPKIFCPIIKAAPCDQSSSSVFGDCDITAGPGDIDVCCCPTDASSFNCSSDGNASSDRPHVETECV